MVLEMEDGLQNVIRGIQQVVPWHPPSKGVWYLSSNIDLIWFDLTPVQEPLTSKHLNLPGFHEICPDAILDKNQAKDSFEGLIWPDQSS